MNKKQESKIELGTAMMFPTIPLGSASQGMRSFLVGKYTIETDYKKSVLNWEDKYLSEIRRLRAEVRALESSLESEKNSFIQIPVQATEKEKNRIRDQRERIREENKVIREENTKIRSSVQVLETELKVIENSRPKRSETTIRDFIANKSSFSNKEKEELDSLISFDSRVDSTIRCYKLDYQSYLRNELYALHLSEEQVEREFLRRYSSPVTATFNYRAIRKSKSVDRTIYTASLFSSIISLIVLVFLVVSFILFLALSLALNPLVGSLLFAFGILVLIAVVISGIALMYFSSKKALYYLIQYEHYQKIIDSYNDKNAGLRIITLEIRAMYNEVKPTLIKYSPFYQSRYAAFSDIEKELSELSISTFESVKATAYIANFEVEKNTNYRLYNLYKASDFEALEKLAILGDYEASAFLAFKNTTNAPKYLDAAVSEGTCDKALAVRSLLYVDPNSNLVDREKGKTLCINALAGLTRECDNGDTFSQLLMHLLAKAYKLPKELFWLRTAARGGNALAECLYAISLYEGVYYRHKDPVAAKKWFIRAAAQNDETALFFLSRYYLEDGNNQKCMECLEKASERGQPLAIEVLVPILINPDCPAQYDVIRGYELFMKLVRIDNDHKKWLMEFFENNGYDVGKFKTQEKTR